MSAFSIPAAVAGRRVPWFLLLAGPVLWSAHFLVVYLLAEAACAEDLLTGRALGLSWLSLVIVVATVVATAGSLAAAVLSARLWRRAGEAERSGSAGADARAFGFIGVLLGVVFAVAVLFVGVPALVLEPCR